MGNVCLKAKSTYLLAKETTLNEQELREKLAGVGQSSLLRVTTFKLKSSVNKSSDKVGVSAAEVIVETAT